MIRAAAYLRVSTSGQIDGESLNTQRTQIQDYCGSRGWELVKIYEDAGISGAKDDRPALQALLAAVKSGEINAVIVRDLSRFGRSARDLLNNIQTLKDCSVTFISPTSAVETVKLLIFHNLRSKVVTTNCVFQIFAANLVLAFARGYAGEYPVSPRVAI